MSAIAIRAYRDRAYLVSDGAHYDQGGIVRSIASKARVSAHTPLAFAITGQLPPFDLWDSALGSQQAFMASTPEIMRRRESHNRAVAPGLPSALQLFAATWTPFHGGRCWAISTDRAWFGDSYAPLTWIDISEAASPHIAAGMLPIRHAFADVDARDILAAQRAQPWPDGLTCVGGFGELATVDRNGARIIRVVDWPDRIDEAIAA